MADLFRDQRVPLMVVVVALVGLFATRWLFSGGPGSLTPDDLVGDTPSPKLMDEHTAEFEQKVIKVSEGVHLAIGYAIANSILIEAPDGAIIVDTTENVEAGREVMAAFRNITQLPVRAIVYTHNHADHMFGTEAFIDRSEPFPEIWAHETLPGLIDMTYTVQQVTYSRAIRQFGTQLRERAPRSFRNAGIGGILRLNRHAATELIMPTHLMKGSLQDVVMAGLPVTLVHIPGETYDQIGVWIPSKKMFFCGDDVYRAFPNLYAIRGTPTRDLMHWVTSLDKMIAYEPEYLVPSHTKPLQGWEDTIKPVLTNFRDGIKVVHDQTVRWMNKGMYPDDIVTKVRLPKHLEEFPWLHTYYGTVEWSVRAVFDRYMGWFSGNIVELSRHSTLEKAKRMVSLGGGEDSLVKAAEKAAQEEDFRWTLELASHVLQVNPGNTEAKNLRLQALKALASQQVSSNGRNYYLSTALEDFGYLESGIPEFTRKAVVKRMPPRKLFQTLCLRLKAEEVEGKNAVVVFDFTDVNEVHTLRLRNSVLDLLEGEPEKFTVKVTVPYKTWQAIIAGEQSAVTLYMSGGLKVEGGVSDFKAFMGYFDRD